MDNIVADDFKVMLMDNFNYHAYTLLPVLLEVIDESELNQNEQELLNGLRNWDYSSDGELIEPAVFRQWWTELYNSIWDNKFENIYPMRRPSRDLTIDLILKEPASPWFNNVHTSDVETLPVLATSSYKSAMENLTDLYGETNEKWKWGNINNTSLNHIAQIPGLGVYNLFTDGSEESINAIRGSHGPSWRMVVELDPEGVRGYGVYPGGQSGNPGSRTYSEFVETWRTGQMYELLFLKEKPDQTDSFPLIIRLE